MHRERQAFLSLLVLGESILDRFPVRNDADLRYQSLVTRLQY